MKCFGYRLDCKEAVMLGALVWIVIFFEVSLLMFGFGLEEGSILNAIHYLLLIPIVGIPTWHYFKDKKVERGFVPGLLVGITFMIVSIILDAIITVPLFVKDYALFFGSSLMWMGYTAMVAISVIVSMVLKKK